MDNIVCMVQCPYCEHVSRYEEMANTGEVISVANETLLCNVTVHNCTNCHRVFLHQDHCKTCSCGRWRYMGHMLWWREKRNAIAISIMALQQELYCENCGDGLLTEGKVVHGWKDNPRRTEGKRGLDETFDGRITHSRDCVK